MFEPCLAEPLQISERLKKRALEIRFKIDDFFESVIEGEAYIVAFQKPQLYNVCHRRLRST
jgi:predicted transposase YdaD